MNARNIRNVTVLPSGHLTSVKVEYRNGTSFTAYFGTKQAAEEYRQKMQERREDERTNSSQQTNKD